MPDDDLPLTRREAAEFISTHYGPFSPNTLAKLACIGGGPEFEKFGRAPIYRRGKLVQWAEARRSLAHCREAA